MSEHRLDVRVLPQPTEDTCGPTCLHGVYQFWGDDIPLADVTRETGSLPDGGTLSVLLASHALRRGYRTTIYSCNVQVFDPSWFSLSPDSLPAKLRAQADATSDAKLRGASTAYVEYLLAGGQLRFANPTEALLRELLLRDVPVLTGLSATWLYQTKRERPDCVADDIVGGPVGHFVVLAGHRPDTRELLVSDPWQANPLSDANRYWLDADRVISAILLGIVTYDATMLIVEPRE